MKKYLSLTCVLLLFCSFTGLGVFSQKFQNSFEGAVTQCCGSSIITIYENGSKKEFASKGTNGDTQFYIGSISKPMTAYMFLTCLQEKHPDVNLEDFLDRKLSDAFPDSVILENFDKAWMEEISIKDLLTHRSGLSCYTDDYSKSLEDAKAMNKAISAPKLLQNITFNPNKGYGYCNTNFYILAKLTQEIAGESLDHIFQRVIKDPADMKNSFLPVTGNYLHLKELPEYKNLACNNNENIFDDMENALGAGSVISTSNDLLKFGELLFSRTSKKVVSLILKNYGYDEDGDIINLSFSTMPNTNIGSLSGHQGNLDSYSGFFGFVFAKKRIIIYLSNDFSDANRLATLLNSYLLEGLVL